MKGVHGLPRVCSARQTSCAAPCIAHGPAAHRSLMLSCASVYCSLKPAATACRYLLKYSQPPAPDKPGLEDNLPLEVPYMPSEAVPLDTLEDDMLSAAV